MSRAERRALVAREASALPVSRQCQLLSVSRASVYRRPAEIRGEDCTIMALIDRQYLARPYYGSRRMAAWLATLSRSYRIIPICSALLASLILRREAAKGGRLSGLSRSPA
jgi:hypothetical protein